MWKWAAAGAALVAAGAWKFNETLAEAGRAAQLADYLAFRCSSGAEGTLTGASAHGPMLEAAMHCWGCPAMAVGAAFMLLPLVRGLGPARRAVLRRQG